MKREQAHNTFESSADFQEAPFPHTLETPHRGATTTTSYDRFTAAMEYTVALEEKDSAQAKCMIDIEASVDSQTDFTEATDFTASAVEIGGSNKEIKEIMSMMKQLTASVTAQAATLKYLSTKTNSGSGGGSR